MLLLMSGLMVPVKDSSALANAVMRLLDDPALCRRLGESARKWIEQESSVARMADRYLSVYQEVLGHQRQPTGHAMGY